MRPDLWRAPTHVLLHPREGLPRAAFAHVPLSPTRGLPCTRVLTLMTLRARRPIRWPPHRAPLALASSPRLPPKPSGVLLSRAIWKLPCTVPAMLANSTLPVAKNGASCHGLAKPALGSAPAACPIKSQGAIPQLPQAPAKAVPLRSPHQSPRSKAMPPLRIWGQQGPVPTRARWL